MYSPEDLKALHEFLKSTGESNLNRMLVDAKFAAISFTVMMKIVRACTSDQFATHAGEGSFPKIKMSAAEMGLKEHFWGTCLAQVESRGLISKQVAAKAA
jgi:hypothetical protein